MAALGDDAYSPAHLESLAFAAGLRVSPRIIESAFLMWRSGAAAGEVAEDLSVAESVVRRLFDALDVLRRNQP